MCSHYCPLALVHTSNNANGNKTNDIFSGIASYYGDTYIVTFKNMKGITMLSSYKEIVTSIVILAN